MIWWGLSIIALFAVIKNFSKLILIMLRLSNKVWNKQLRYNDVRKCHFSVDDVIGIFKDLARNEGTYQSIFDNRELRYLKTLHDNYAIIVYLYCFYEDLQTFNLKQVTDCYSREFEENSSWLKVGFHGLNSLILYNREKADVATIHYNLVTYQLVKICGQKSITQTVRLSGYQGSEECIQAFHECNLGIKGLLIADDKRNSYFLTSEEISTIRKEGYALIKGITYYSTNLRVENLSVIDMIRFKPPVEDFFAFFTHEYYLNSRIKRIIIEMLIIRLIHNQYHFTDIDKM